MFFQFIDKVQICIFKAVFNTIFPASVTFVSLTCNEKNHIIDIEEVINWMATAFIYLFLIEKSSIKTKKSPKGHTGGTQPIFVLQSLVSLYTYPYQCYQIMALF